jgi:hypothetical protein
MPYGLPGAVKLKAVVRAHDWDTRRVIVLQSGAILAPLFPGADQDGFDGEWCCMLAATGQRVAMPRDALPGAK